MVDASKEPAKRKAGNAEVQDPPKRARYGSTTNLENEVEILTEYRIDYSSSVIRRAIVLAPSTRKPVRSVKATFSVYKSVVCSRSKLFEEFLTTPGPVDFTDCTTKEVFQVYLDWIHAQYYGSPVELATLIEAQLDARPSAKCTFGEPNYAEDWSKISFLCMLWMLGIGVVDISFVNKTMECLLAQDPIDAQNALCHGEDLKLVDFILSEFEDYKDSGLERWLTDVVMSTISSGDLDFDDISEKSTRLSASIMKKLWDTRPSVAMPTASDIGKYQEGKF